MHLIVTVVIVIVITWSLCVHCRHQRVAEGQPTVTEPSQDSDHVAGHQSAAGQDHHQICTTSGVTRME